MDDEELRARLDGMLGTAAPVRIPPVSAIRRRMRRRQAAQATAGALACACVAVAAVLVGEAVGRTGPAGSHGFAPPAVPACTGRHIQLTWLRAVPIKGVFMEAPPETFLLGLRNTGPAACALRGWPGLRILRRPAHVSISFGTLSTVLLPPDGSRSISRQVRPTWVRLSPGDSAVSAMTVDLPPDLTGCDRPGWIVTPPGTGRASKVGGGPPMLCAYSSISVSPVYPARVPISQNYPPRAPSVSPAATTNPQPRAAAGAAAAPYFVTIGKAKASSPAVVRAWRTGKVTATIQPPAGSGPFTGVAGAGDDATFVLAAGTTRTSFYQLSLWHGTGSTRKLVPLPVPRIATPDTPFAVSADGSQLALALPAGRDRAKITVVSLVTGSTLSWTSDVPGTVSGLTWAGNVRLGFVWSAGSGTGQAGGSGLRVLDISRPGSDLLGSRLLIPAAVRFDGLRGLAYPLASADGKVVFATMTSHSGGSGRAAVAEFSLVTGRPIRLITPRADESGFGTWCGALWADPAGSTMLAACRVQGEEHDGRFTPADLHFPAPNLSAGPDFFAW